MVGSKLKGTLTNTISGHSNQLKHQLIDSAPSFHPNSSLTTSTFVTILYNHFSDSLITYGRFCKQLKLQLIASANSKNSLTNQHV